MLGTTCTCTINQWLPIHSTCPAMPSKKTAAALLLLELFGHATSFGLGTGAAGTASLSWSAAAAATFVVGQWFYLPIIITSGLQSNDGVICLQDESSSPSSASSSVVIIIIIIIIIIVIACLATTIVIVNTTHNNSTIQYTSMQYGCGLGSSSLGIWNRRGQCRWRVYRRRGDWRSVLKCSSCCSICRGSVILFAF